MPDNKSAHFLGARGKRQETIIRPWSGFWVGDGCCGPMKHVWVIERATVYNDGVTEYAENGWFVFGA